MGITIKVRVRLSLLDKRDMYVEGISAEKFLQYDPPCKKCLINNMCLSDHHANLPYTNLPCYDYMMVRYCGELKKFLNNNKLFYYSKL